MLIDAYIRFKIAPAWGGAEDGKIIDLPYKAEYLPSKHQSEAFHLYDLYMTINDNYIKASRITPSREMVASFEDKNQDDCAIRYFMFEQTIEKLIKMGGQAGSKQIFVGTSIPFADEVLVDKGFSLKRSEFNKANLKGRKKL